MFNDVEFLCSCFGTGVIFKTFHKFNMNDTLDVVASALDHDPFVLIVSEQRCFSGGGRRTEKKRKISNASDDKSDDGAGTTATATSASSLSPPTKAAAQSNNNAKVVNLVSGIVSRIDLLDFISSGPQ